MYITYTRANPPPPHPPQPPPPTHTHTQFLHQPVSDFLDSTCKSGTGRDVSSAVPLYLGHRVTSCRWLRVPLGMDPWTVGSVHCWWQGGLQVQTKNNKRPRGPQQLVGRHACVFRLSPPCTGLRTHYACRVSQWPTLKRGKRGGRPLANLIQIHKAA